MRRIPLTQGKEALVSDCDYKYLVKWKWCYAKVRKGGYAVRNGPKNKPKRTIHMHRVVAARKGIKGRVDHRDQNKLNNQRRNIRAADYSQNGANRGAQRDNTSGFKGVYRDKSTGMWRAQLKYHGKWVYRELFTTKIAAARAYNKAAKRYFGKFASLNKIGTSQ